MTATGTQKTNPIVIKKYANRRLYNTDTSTYVTLEDLCSMIKTGEEVIVYDAKNGDDITRSVLTQIIVEQESKGQSLLPTAFLRQLIGFYGNSMQGLVPRYLEYTMQSFAKNQGPMQDYFSKAFGGMFNLGSLEEMGKQNMAMFDQAMKMFAPFAEQMTQTGMQAAQNGAAQMQNAGEQARDTARNLTPDALKPAFDAAAKQGDEGIKVMQQRLDDLQKQIAALSKKED